MKRKLFLYFALLSSVFSMPAIAQSSMINFGGSDEKKLIVDKVQYRITYKMQLVHDTTALDSLGGYHYFGDEMRLDIGDLVSHFYSYLTARRDSIMLKMVERGDFDFSGMKGGTVSWVLYKNYPQGKNVYLDRSYTGKYRISETMQSPEWTIVPDSMKQILGYSCQMAKTDFKGRQWIAWYSEDIPLDNGPWKLCGLPGLILHAHDASKQYIFDAMGLEQLNGKADISYKEEYDSREEVTMKQFSTIKRKSTLGDMLAGMGGNHTITAKDANGNDLDVKQLLNNREPYNPIER